MRFLFQTMTKNQMRQIYLGIQTLLIKIIIQQYHLKQCMIIIKKECKDQIWNSLVKEILIMENWMIFTLFKLLNKFSLEQKI